MEPNLISKNQKDFKFFTINPPITSITINNNRIVRKVIEIKNLMVFPVIYKLRSSDTRSVEINKTRVKLNSNKAEKIELIFHMDYLNTKKNNLNENIFVFFESDVCDYKYPISISKSSSAGNKRESLNNINTQIYVERISNNNSNNNYVRHEDNSIADSDLKKIEKASEITNNSKNAIRDEIINMESEVYPTFQGNNSEEAEKNKAIFSSYSIDNTEEKNYLKQKHSEKQLSVDSQTRYLDNLRNSFSRNSSREKSNKRSTSQNHLNYLGSNSTKEKLNEYNNNNPILHTSNATFFPLYQGKESLISSYDSRKNDDFNRKNFQEDSVEENQYEREYKKVLPKNNKYNELNNKENKKYSSSVERELSNDHNSNKLNFQYSNEKSNNNYLEKFEEFKMGKQNNPNSINRITNKKDYLEGLSTSVLKERFIRLLFQNYEENKRNYDNVIEIIDFFLSYLKNLELKYSIVHENSKHLDNNLKIYRSLSESKFKNKNYPNQEEKNNLEQINKILRSSSVSSQNSNLSDKNNNIINNISFDNKDNLDLNLENIVGNQKEILFLKNLMQDFLRTFSATINENYSQHRNIIASRLENSANIPHLSNEQVEYLFREIQNLYALNSEINTYKIQTENLLLNIEAMKKNMKSIASSIENYKNNALKAENDKKEAEKRILQLVNIIKSKDRLIDKLNYELKGKGNDPNEIKNIKYPVIEIDHTPADNNERLSYANNPNLVLNNDEIDYFKNSLAKKDKYINKLKQKLYENERVLMENKLVSHKNLRENKGLKSDKKTNKKRNHSLNEKNRYSNRKYKESYVSLYNSNSSYTAQSRSKSKSVSNEKDTRSGEYSKSKGNFNDTNFTKNLNNNYNYSNVFNKNLSREISKQQRNDLFSTHPEENKNPSEEAFIETNNLDLLSKEDNVFIKNYNTEQNIYENPIYDNNRDYNFKYDIDPENKFLNNEKSSFSYTPKSHINKASSANKLFGSNLKIKAENNSTDFRTKYNDELKDNLLNISGVSGANRYNFNKNLYSSTANSYLNIKDDISFTKKNIEILMNKLSSNKKSLTNLIDDLSFSKNEFIRNNKNEINNNKFVSKKKFNENPYENYKKNEKSNDYMNLVENYDSSEDNDYDVKRNKYEKNSSMII